MGPAPIFVCWLLGSVVLVVFAPDGGVVILGAGLIGGLTHALIAYRRGRKPAQ